MPLTGISLKTVRKGSLQNISNLNPSLIFINIFVNNRATRALIDSGATHSFITQAALTRIRHSALLPSNIITHLADNSSPLNILGEINLTIHVNDILTPLAAQVVKKLNFYFILGVNWFIQTGARIEYDRHQVSIHSYHGRSVIPFNKNINHLALDVKLLNTITLPPREASVVQGRTDISSADAVYFDPDSDYLTCKLIQIALAMLKVPSYCTFLKILNTSDFPRTLYKNAIIGHVIHIPADVESFPIQPPSYSSEHDRSFLNFIRTTTSCTYTSETIEKLINHIHDPVERNGLQKILSAHAKIFDLSKITQAHTSLQHIINTFDALPIGSRPYPKIVDQRRELQNVI
ncbi:unnamed protein product [Didymodactylos carnosus]|uniref:Peptidase A2 domain-containing protein n=1 Tax=Didymodactylos carnosus TaxID=1234261 RepID=A0A8S2EEV6_9BILA|nr:unnamed protein product [Didymodactylos carnosus]CAF4018620.1 unnamed protein product [Didymodactylos carnosus]